MLILLAAFAAQLPTAAPATADEIVVTARRSGAPVWRVSRGGATLVLVGTIRDIAKGTRWDPAALDQTVARANRVMFPEMMGVSASPFQLIGWLAKWKRMAKLPRGQSLSALISPNDRARLARLAAQGLAPADWDRYHPLHLGQKLQDVARRQAGKGRDPTGVVQRSARKNKVDRVPIATGKASPLVKDLFASSPREHVACLRASLDFAEGGSAELRRRSNAWAARQISQAVRSPLSKAYDDCWPATEAPPAMRVGIANTIATVLAGRSGTVLAVFDLNSLAETGGILDRLKASGASVDGPAWR